MRYIKLGVALLAVFTLTSGLALLTTGWIIVGSANTKNAEKEYQELVYNHALAAADKLYTEAVETAENEYKADHAKLLEDAGGSIPGDLVAKAEFNENNTKLIAAQEAKIKAAAKLCEDTKAEALQKYNRAILNIKRNFTGDDAGQTFSGTYRVADILTTVETTENGNADWHSTTYRSVLSPEGKLLVVGMILTLIGLSLGASAVCAYLGVFEKIITNSKKPKEPKEPKEPPMKVPEGPERQEKVPVMETPPPQPQPAPQPAVEDMTAQETEKKEEQDAAGGLNLT
jgi:hypothetical protein